MTVDPTFWLRVSGRVREVESVVSLYLEEREGGSLPPWTPGAHIDLVLPSGRVRQYSLNGSYRNEHEYRIGVLLDPETRGGSREVHEAPLVGVQVQVRGPRNHFPLEEAEGYVFLAGGIGITPILPMLERAEELERPWRLVYGARSRASMAYLDEILGRSGGEVVLVPQDEQGLPDFEGVLAKVGSELVYACGPPAMLSTVEQLAGELLSVGQLRVERFTAAESDSLVLEENRPFEVELRRTGVTSTVPPDRSMLDVVLDAVPSYEWGCSEGYCGTCIARVLEGLPEHRDSCLTDEERASNTLVTPCVSRARGGRLVLDI